MITENIGTFIMYNPDTGVFNPPDNEKTYDWPTEDFKITNWNTWMRALAYWLRDKLDFEISSGPGTTTGMWGYINSRAGEGWIQHPGTGCDNDWTNDNYGIYPITSKNGESRCESPFRPYTIDGEYYYTNGETDEKGNYIWTGKWKGTEIFDDKQNRFDIILTNNSYNNLGFRIKYPVTTTGFYVPHTRYDAYGIEIENVNTIRPQLFPTNNKAQIAVLFDCNKSYDNYSSTRKVTQGFATAIGGKINNSDVSQYSFLDRRDTSIIKMEYVKLNNIGMTEVYPWIPNFLTYVTNKKMLFENFLSCNSLQYIRSYDNSVLVLIIFNTITKEKALELCIYKNLDNTSGMLVAEDVVQTRNNSYHWVNDNGHEYWDYTLEETVVPERYGNYGNIVVSSDNSGRFIPYRVKPIKYSKDVRDTSAGSLIDTTGLWRLEQFCGLPSSGTYSKNLYLVTRAGTNELIPTEGKYIMGSLSGKKTKFYVFPFNSRTLQEYNTTDSITLFAVPIEKEE